MKRTLPITACLLLTGVIGLAQEERPNYPSFDYEEARAHEIQPHRRTIPLAGVQPGTNQLHLTLTVSPTGDVLDADAGGGPNDLKYWPQLKSEVLRWTFKPFEKDGTPITVEVEEYIDLVPPERLPKTHVAAPAVQPNSDITIELERTGCLGSCPGYSVTLSTKGIVFEGRGYVVARGKHTAAIAPGKVRESAKEFVRADFYSMDARYAAPVTDSPSYALSITIDGHQKRVSDYVGAWVGMPQVVTRLEDEVDTLADTSRWTEGGDGLVTALRGERFNFKSAEAQAILKDAAGRGKTATVKALLEAGVPLTALPVPKAKRPESGWKQVGWLTAASAHPDTLQVLIDAGASKADQEDKDLALAGAARSGQVEAARALVSYGANPNINLTNLTVTLEGGGMTLQGPGAGSVLIYAAESGNPDMVREILHFHPKLEARDHKGRTAIFSAGEYAYKASDEARAECVRLLVEAGADVNARDNDGNTPLHEIYLTAVETELLKLGADVNARNNDGETPIFTTVDNDLIPVLLSNGADLTIRNNKGETVQQAAREKGAYREKILLEAISKHLKR